MYLCGCVCTCFIRVTLRAPNQSQKCFFFLCLFTFDFSSCSFLSSLLAAMFSHPIPHTRNITPALIHLPAIFYSCPLISATSLLYTLCSVSAVCLDIWWAEVVCASNISSPVTSDLTHLLIPLSLSHSVFLTISGSLASRVSHPRVLPWMQLTVWFAVASWLWKK